MGERINWLRVWAHHSFNLADQVGLAGAVFIWLALHSGFLAVLFWVAMNYVSGQIEKQYGNEGEVFGAKDKA